MTLDALPGPIAPNSCDDWETARQHPECKRVANLILAAANARAELPLIASDRKRMWPIVVEWVQAGYAPELLADAIAAAPVRTGPGVALEMDRQRRGLRAVVNGSQRQRLDTDREGPSGRVRL